MPRSSLRAATLAAFFVTGTLTPVFAQSGSSAGSFDVHKAPPAILPDGDPATAISGAQTAKPLPPLITVPARLITPVPQRVRAVNTQSQPAPPADAPTAAASPGSQTITPGYPYLNAPMYPTPSPNVPYQTGGTMITNQALSPHEMLHPHSYKAMYPPFYYRVRGHWVVTPHGVQSREVWSLEGTTVSVKYRSKWRPFSGFKPAIRR